MFVLFPKMVRILWAVRALPQHLGCGTLEAIALLRFVLPTLNLKGLRLLVYF